MLNKSLTNHKRTMGPLIIETKDISQNKFCTQSDPEIHEYISNYLPLVSQKLFYNQIFNVFLITIVNYPFIMFKFLHRS